MEYKKDVEATYDNSFCIDSSCINYFECMCMLCMTETKDIIFPASTVYLNQRGSGKCRSHRAGTNLAYLMEKEVE